jgi:hypothetical protein
LTNALFAYGYNVGDTHVFYLPSHLMIALLAAPGIVLAGAVVRHRRFATMLLVVYAGARGWHDYPALDRSRDTRPTTVLANLTAGVDDRRAILLTDLNWQLQNGLTYFAKRTSPEVAYARMPAVVLYAPALIASNTAINRRVILSDAANRTLSTAYGPLLATERDPATPAPSLARMTAGVPAGTRYVLCLLKPTRDMSFDWTDIGESLSGLAGGRAIRVPDGDYVAIAGIQGQPPLLVLGSNKPFRRSVTLDGASLEIRMDSWLAADTIRRMGFGHVVVEHQHALIVERGASFVAFDRAGTAVLTAYASSIFAPQSRFIVLR